jgi:hypothetical protein
MHLPVLWDAEEGYSLRPTEQIVARAAVLNVAVTLSYGMPMDLASAWLLANGLTGCLSAKERALLAGEPVDSTAVRCETEAIWAFAWMLGLANHLRADRYCDDDLVLRLPNLKSGETLEQWSTRVGPVLRKADDVMAELDLYYCLTWGLAEANLRNQQTPAEIEQYVIWERRRALEFALVERAWNHEDWDEIDLST